MADKEGAEQGTEQKWFVLIVMGLDMAFIKMSQEQKAAFDSRLSVGFTELYRPLKVVQGEPGRISIFPLMPDCDEKTILNVSSIVAYSELKNRQLIGALDKALVQVYSGLVIPTAGDNGAGAARPNLRLIP